MCSGKIFLNGMDARVQSPGWLSFLTFTLNSGFVPGTNFVEFRVTNVVWNTGLRVENRRGTAQKLPPQLALTAVASNLILSWPINFVGYTLQTTPGLGSPAWATNLPAPVVVSGQYIVIIPISGTQQFFRLSR
jgi:hypothetical protein